MSTEMIAPTAQQDVATALLDQLLHEPEQQRLFIPEGFYDLEEENVAWAREKNPGRLVVKASLVNEYRYRAAMHGAGFHPSQFEDIRWVETGETGVGHYVDPLGGVHIRHLPSRRGRPNRMWDEIREELFTAHVPTTHYEAGACVTSEEDLKKIFIFDQENLLACKWLYDEDVLYEKENL